MSIGTKKEEAKEVEQDPDEMLFFAASMGDIKKAQAAIKKGADVNSRHVNQNTALHAASVQSKYDVMKLLVESGADVNAKNQDGLTPLMMVAFETGDAKAAVLLLDSKARVDEKDRNGVTALDLAKDGYEKNREVWQEIFDLLTLESKKP
jgi:ankyrin repeat protein